MILYGQETEKAIEILGPGQTPRVIIRAYGEVKLAAVRAQQDTAGLYPDDYFPLLEETCHEVIRVIWTGTFPFLSARGERAPACI